MRFTWKLHLLAALVAASATAGAPAARAQEMQFRHLTPSDGLSSSIVQTILRDDRGFMWFGTNKGLNRYDGYEVTVYKHRVGDSTSLATDGAEVTYQDSRKALWVGTYAGLSRFDPARDAFTNYPIVPGDTIAVWAISEVDGVLLAGTSRGVFAFDRATGKATPYLANVFGGLQIQTIHKDHAGHLWIGTKGGGARDVDPRTGAVRTWTANADQPAPKRLAGMDVRTIVEDESGAIWMALMDGGVARVDRERATVTNYLHDPRDPQSLSINVAHTLLLDGMHGLWIGTENGGLEYLDFATRRFRHMRFDPSNPSGINSNSVWALYRDPIGSLWAGTFAGGVNIARPNGDAIRSYRSIAGDPTSLSFNSVKGFHEDRHGNMWIATDGGGLDRFDRATGKFTRYDMRNSGLKSDAVLAITEDRAGVLWLATWAGGVSRFDPATNRFTAFTTKNSAIADDAVFGIHTDAAGHVWVGTDTHGLQRIDPLTGTIATYRVKEGAQPQIRTMLETQDGKLLLATNLGGMIEFDPATGATRQWNVGDGLSGNRVQAILETEPFVDWIGTDNGLDRLDRRTGAIQHFTEADGLASAATSGIVADPAGRLWLSGERGITRFDPVTRKTKIYTVADGLQGSEFNGGAYYRTRDGTMFFGGSEGFSTLAPDRISENRVVPPVAITGFQLNNRGVLIGAPGSPLRTSIGTSERLVFSHDAGVFTLQFSALDYTAPQKNQYAYLLEEFEKEWNLVGAKRTASYTNLPPGHYTFRVKGTNSDGVWNEVGASVEIVVTPPFWATWWFRTLVGLLILGTIAAIIRSAQQRHRTLEAMNEQLGRAAEHDRESQQYLEGNVLDILGAMQKFSAGDYSVALAVRSEDAIGKLRLGFNSVVADRKRAEEELRQSQKMEAVGRLAGGVAHDFNNLLTVIKGNAELALADLEENDVVREELEEIERASERASSLTRQLLAFSRKQILKPQTLLINELVIDLARMLRRTLGEDVELTIALEPMLCAVCADPGQLEQVVLNLVVNARDAMPRGGVLRVETRNVDAATAAQWAEAEPGVAYVAILVSDNGTGMTADVQERLFEPFFTTKEQGKGTGLGLSTVYGSVKQSGGFVLVESALGTGSTFGVYLPRVKALVESSSIEEIDHAPSGTATVLLVEDEDAVRRLASRSLVRAGYTVITAANGDAAMDAAAAHVGEIDLLLTDVVMPGVSGRELAERLMPLHPGMRLLYASGYTEDAIIRHGVSSQETAFLEKPFTPTGLLRKVRRVLDDPAAARLTAV